MKLNIPNCVAALIAVGIAPLTAGELKLHPELAAAAAKVDTAGSFFEVDLVKEDLDRLLPYAELIGEMLTDLDDDGPKVDFHGMLGSSGLLDISAVARSNARHGTSWINKIYLANGGSRKGIFSLVAGDRREFRVARMSPAGADLALELQADLSQLSGLIQSMGGALGVAEEAGQQLEKEVKHLGMTIGEALGRTAFTLQLAMIFDTGKVDETTLLPETKDMVGRIDGMTWFWGKAGEALLEEGRSKGTLDFTRSETGGVVTYAITSKGLTPSGTPAVIEVETEKDTIWLASSAEFLTRSRAGASQLSDDPEFQTAWEGMPGSGNAMAYVSPRLFRAVVGSALPVIGSFAEGLSEPGEDGDVAGRLLGRIAKDLTAADRGIAFSASRDEGGLLMVSKLPFPGKYLNDLFVGDLLYDLLLDPSLLAPADEEVALSPEELDALIEESRKETREAIKGMGLDEETSKRILDNMEEKLRKDLGGLHKAGRQGKDGGDEEVALSPEEVDAQMEKFLKLWREEMEKSGLLDEESLDQLLEGTREEMRKELRRSHKAGRQGGAGE